MKICFLVYKNKKVGMGHFYRTMTLADTCRNNDHSITIIGNTMFTDLSYPYFQMRYGPKHKTDFYHILHQVKPDWLVIDLQDKVPQYIYSLCKQFKVKTLLLNGVGREWESKANISITQGYSNGIYSGSKYIILRPEVFNFQSVGSDEWFVFGGTADKMKLTSAFNKNMINEPAKLVVTKFSRFIPKQENPIHVFYEPEGKGFIPLMALSNKTCLAMGMTVWESVVMQKPTYVFSASLGHLRFAQAMEENGLIKAFPQVGIPAGQEFKEFLSSDFHMTGVPPDKWGATRVMKLMENYE